MKKGLTMTNNTDRQKLVIRDLSVTMGKKLILDHLNFEVMDGEFLSILGPSGCGKTTILRILIGLLSADTGSVHKDGVDITKAAPSKRGMGIVFQNYALFENMTVLRNVEYALRLDKSKKDKAREIAMDMLRQVGLEEHANKKPGKLSGGQQQRVAIARALALQPEVLCFDEPTSALDPELTGEVLRVIRGLKGEDSTMIVVTHEMDFARNVADKVIFMADGIIEEMGTPQQIFDAPTSEKTRAFLHGLENSF